MLTNSMIYGRFRYYVQVEPMPRSIEEALVSDAQALMWGKDVQFDPEELGTELKNRRWIKKGVAYFLPARRFAIGAQYMDL